MNQRLAIVLLVVAANVAIGCRHGHGPHLQLSSPAGASPRFGDAPNRSAESLHQGGGGGGGWSNGDPAGGPGASGGSANGNPAPAIVGGAIGLGAFGAAVAAGKIQCKPGELVESEATVNLCSGEPRPALPKPGE